VIHLSEAKALARQLTGLADPTRLLVAYLLAGGPHHVTQLAGLTGVSVANMTHHLRMMRLAGLVDRQRQGRSIAYSLRPRIFTPGGRPGGARHPGTGDLPGVPARRGPPAAASEDVSRRRLVRLPGAAVPHRGSERDPMTR
jgi:DNA-binding transcriptional ArsR family regulator